MTSMCLSLIVAPSLGAIYYLDFIDEVLLEFLQVTGAQELVEVNGAFGQLLTVRDMIAFLNNHSPARRDAVALLNLGVRILYDYLPSWAYIHDPLHDAFNSRDYRRACLENFSDTRKPARYVPLRGGAPGVECPRWWSWVPGSPIHCAAIMPTASPSLTRCQWADGGHSTSHRPHACFRR